MDKKAIRAAVDEILDNQLRDNNPPETRQTLSRLQKEGRSLDDARALISQCIVVELFDVIKHKRAFDEARFIKNLKNLPKQPFD